MEAACARRTNSGGAGLCFRIERDPGSPLAILFASIFVMLLGICLGTARSRGDLFRHGYGIQLDGPGSQSLAFRIESGIPGSTSARMELGHRQTRRAPQIFPATAYAAAVFGRAQTGIGRPLFLSSSQPEAPHSIRGQLRRRPRPVPPCAVWCALCCPSGSWRAVAPGDRLPSSPSANHAARVLHFIRDDRGAGCGVGLCWALRLRCPASRPRRPEGVRGVINASRLPPPLRLALLPAPPSTTSTWPAGELVHPEEKRTPLRDRSPLAFQCGAARHKLAPAFPFLRVGRLLLCIRSQALGGVFLRCVANGAEQLPRTHWEAIGCPVVGGFRPLGRSHFGSINVPRLRGSNRSRFVRFCHYDTHPGGHALCDVVAVAVSVRERRLHFRHVSDWMAPGLILERVWDWRTWAGPAKLCHTWHVAHRPSPPSPFRWALLFFAAFPGPIPSLGAATGFMRFCGIPAGGNITSGAAAAPPLACSLFVLLAAPPLACAAVRPHQTRPLTRAAPCQPFRKQVPQQ